MNWRTVAPKSILVVLMRVGGDIADITNLLCEQKFYHIGSIEQMFFFVKCHKPAFLGSR